MRPKTAALALLGLVAFSAPLTWWYHADKRERSYEAGALMNAGVVAASVIALPVYFIRSRGWKRGMTASAVAAAVLALTLLLGEIGERIGALLAS